MRVPLLNKKSLWHYALALSLAYAFLSNIFTYSALQAQNPLEPPHSQATKNRSQTSQESVAPISSTVEKTNENSATFPVPNESALILRTPSLSFLDSSFSTILEHSIDAKISVLSSLRLTSYRRILNSLDLHRPAGLAVWYASSPQFVLFLPINRDKFATFAADLKKISSLNASLDRSKQIVSFTSPSQAQQTYVAKQIANDYLVIAKNDVDLDETFKNSIYPPSISPELREPFVSVDVTPRGLELLRERSEDLEKALQTFFQTANLPKDMIEQLSLESALTTLSERVADFRLDVATDDFGLYASLQTEVAPGQGSNQLFDYPFTYPLNLSADRFFTVLPEVETSIAGQADLPQSLSSTLPPPFNRVRFVEYSLGLPTAQELAAESWLFFLEVDDSELFAQEMIVPRAREIGRYIGSKQVADAASQILGSAAERRLARQTARRTPSRRLASPERAAEIGETIGGTIGALIGEKAGEESAMKEYRLNGYKMYVSDLETFARQSALMKAEKEGRYVPLSDGLPFSPIDALISAIRNDGQLQNAILATANAQAQNLAQSPLLAQKGYLVILDKHTLLYGLGNQELLKLAINNYRATKESNVRYLSLASSSDSMEVLQNLGKHIPDPSNVNIVGSTRIDLAGSLTYYKWLRHFYIPQAPELNLDLPSDSSKILLISSIKPPFNLQRAAIPFSTINHLLDALEARDAISRLLIPQQHSSPNSSEEETDFDFEFED